MDELTEEQLKQLKQELLQLETELQELMDMSREGVQIVELDQPIGRLTRMDAIQHQQMAKVNREGHGRRLTLVRAAIQAHSRAEFGFCKRCEEPIGFKRLKARPESPLCLVCQSASEKLHTR